ncbi:MAG TPA: hypothetical protein VK348_10215, partial [Planctomycetota bacterium]|nr:hypothetical protein [Planctomycetota bacterium]
AGGASHGSRGNAKVHGPALDGTQVEVSDPSTGPGSPGADRHETAPDKPLRGIGRVWAALMTSFSSWFPREEERRK